MTYVYNRNRRVVRGARAIGMKGQELEDKASEILVKNWHPGMRSEGTIKHVYVIVVESVLSCVGSVWLPNQTNSLT